MPGPESVIRSPVNRRGIGEALAKIPQGVFILTAGHETRIRGLMVSWVQQASFEPPMLVVALRKGRDVVPIIHNAHAFAINQVAPDDRLLMKRFGEHPASDERLLGLETARKTTGAPVLVRAMAWMDCELIRHIDVEADHDIYVGMILDGGINRHADVPVHLRDNGFKY
jgi:flavin reductase (DIM6/NTAB) family NADH-FMN oxidoreductase RutF